MTEDPERDRRHVLALGDLAVRIAGITDADQVGAAAVGALTAAGLPFAMVYRCDGPRLRLTDAQPAGAPGATPAALAEAIATGVPATLPATLFTAAT
ncbi:hypothetical protein, partial [Actinophytocola sediminis]